MLADKLAVKHLARQILQYGNLFILNFELLFTREHSFTCGNLKTSCVLKRVL